MGLDLSGAANSLAGGDLVFPSYTDEYSYVPVINAPANEASQITRAGSTANNDFFGSLLGIGSNFALGSARAISDSVIQSLANQVNGNNDAAERARYESLNAATQQPATSVISSSTLFIVGGILAAVMGLVAIVAFWK
jgi:hypothetical protein